MLNRAVAFLSLMTFVLGFALVFGGAALAQQGVTSPNTNVTPEANPFNRDLVTEVGGALPREYQLSANASPLELTVRIIRILLSFVGILLVGLLVYAGYLWMTAAGADEQISTAKATMKNAVIGLIVIMMAWTLSTYIIRRIQVATRAYGRGGLLQGVGTELQEGAIRFENRISN